VKSRCVELSNVLINGYRVDTEVTPAETLELVQQAMAAGARHTRFFGLDEGI